MFGTNKKIKQIDDRVDAAIKAVAEFNGSIEARTYNLEGEHEANKERINAILDYLKVNFSTAYNKKTKKLILICKKRENVKK